MNEQCPSCLTRIQKKDSVCPTCNMDLQAYREIHELSEITDQLKNRIQSLQNHILQSSSKPAPSVTLEELQKDRPLEAPTVKQPENETIGAAATKTEQKSNSSWFQRGQSEAGIGQMWLLITGIAVTLLGIAFFLKYAFDKNWVGPAGRVALAYLGGLVFTFSGEWLRRKYSALGLSLIGGGLAVLYLSTFTGYSLYHILSAPAAFGLMILITILTGMLSVYYNAYWLSIVGIIGGFASPLLIQTETPSHTVFLSYILLLNGGVVSISFYKQWPSLHRISFLFTWPIFFTWAFSYLESNLQIALAFITVYYVIFMFAPYAYYLKNTSVGNLSGLGITIPNGILSFATSLFILNEILEQDRSVSDVDFYMNSFSALLALFYAILPILFATHFYRKEAGSPGKAFDILLVQAMLFIGLIVPFIFSADWFAIYWAIQGAGLFYIGLRLRNTNLIVVSSFFQFISIISFFYTVSNPYGSGDLITEVYPAILISNLIQFLFVGGFFFLVPLIYRKHGTGESEQKPVLLDRIYRLYPGAGTILLFFYSSRELVNLLSIYFPGSVQAGISILWGFFAIGLIATGIFNHSRVARITGIVLFAITAIKLLVIDMSGVDAPYRILSFIALGIVMILSSYMYFRFKDRILEKGKIDDQ